MTAKRCFIALSILLVMIVAILLRLIYLQIIESSYYSTLSKNNRVEIIPIPPTRGLIYDRNGVVIAKNTPVFTLYLQPSKITDLATTIEQLSQDIPITAQEKQAFYKLRKQYRSIDQIPLKYELSEAEVATFAVHRYKFPGVTIGGSLIRNYPFANQVAHVVGYVGQINSKELAQIDKANYRATHYIGKTGIEKVYQETLHGHVGYQEIEVDAAGNKIRNLALTPAVPGKNLTLTIDNTLQSIAYDALKGYTGAVVAIDPNNGEVLALVSNPSFDPNAFVNGLSIPAFQQLSSNPERPMYDRAVSGLYPPGSTIKPFIAIQGLNTQTIDPTEKIFDPGYFKLPYSNHLFHDWLRRGHGYVNLHQAIVESCDTYFYRLANKMHISKLDQILSQFGFGEKTHIDMPKELAGIVPTPDWKKRHKGHPWYPGDTLNTGIGQGYMLVTPLQLASATATLGARGKRYQPHLVKSQSTGNVTIENLPKPLASITLADDAYWEEVIHAMIGVIKEAKGTGYRYGRNTPYTVAAKTGTAQVFSTQDKRVNKADIPLKLRDNGLFIALAPADKPIIAVAVIVEHSGVIAPHVARKMIDYYLQSYLEPSHAPH